MPGAATLPAAVILASFASPHLAVNSPRTRAHRQAPRVRRAQTQLVIEGRESIPPVAQGEGIAELLDTLEMRGVARHQFQAVLYGNGGDHRIGQADV
jgi:hypothetical protein